MINGKLQNITKHEKHTEMMLHNQDALIINSLLQQINQIIAGAIAGCVTRAITQPFDVLKIRFQLQVEPMKAQGFITRIETSTAQSKYTSLWQATRTIFHEEGVRAFWKGHNSGQMMSITYAISQFWCFEQIKIFLKNVPMMKSHNYAINFISGAAAGSISTALSTPFDVIRTRMVAQDHGAGYRNSFQAFPTILRQEGPRGLFRGLGVAMVQIVPLVGGNFMFYSIFNDAAAHILKNDHHHLPMWCLLINGGAAGVASKALVYPLDFIKKRLQIQGFENQRTTFGQTQRCTSIMNCIHSTLKHEGVLGFYKGLVPTLYKSGATTALYFSIYDKAKELLMKN